MSAVSRDPTSARTTARIVNRQGLHARPISMIVQIAHRFDAELRVCGPDGTIADGKSVFSLMTLAAGQGADLVLEGNGTQAGALVEAVAELVARGFDEDR